jgi:hypothetical protein
MDELLTIWSKAQSAAPTQLPFRLMRIASACQGDGKRRGGSAMAALSPESSADPKAVWMPPYG